jgi:GTP-binding protein
MTAAPERDPLVIRDLAFLGGMAAPGGWRPPPELPEIAFAGRSNVGKSSLLNRLVRRKAFARVSRTPGRTREINFFRVNDQLVFADLPGYGYARVAHEQRDTWRPLIEGYLRHSERLQGVVQLLDIRREASDDDRLMLEFLGDLGVPTIVVITKIDKVASRAAAERIAALSRSLALSDDQVIPFSAVTGAGRDELAEAIVSLIAQPSWRVE